MESKTLLAVDLDGSLVKTDMLYETLIRAVFKKIWVVFLLPFWLAKGIAHCKAKLAAIGEPDVTCLPYNSELLEWLKAEKAQGRELVLCTGSYISLAQAVADHLDIFSDVIATDEKTNLTGSNKAQKLLEKYGEKGFSYVGNEAKDSKVWKHAATAVVVSGESSVMKHAEKVTSIEKHFDVPGLSLKVFFKAIRIHQWSKNALLFVPLLTAHKIFDVNLLIASVIGFIAFGVCASATYLINDLSDLDSDRHHWKKQFRPLAASTLSIKHGILICALMLIGAIIASLILLPLSFVYVLLMYIAITLGYSFWFKRLQTVDIVVLASLYTVRLFAGSAAVDVQPSFWLLAFSMFVFLCLAIVKRISEIMKKMEQDSEVEKLSGRGYFVSDLPVLTSLGASSGMVSILVFAMYVNSTEIMQLYKTPMLLWAVCPLIGYWIIRVLIITSRGQMDEDPISFAIKDKRSWLAGGSAFVVVLLSWLVEF